MIDIAIVGAGPAGLSAAVYASRAGYSCTVFEELGVGGQLTSIDNLENYPGFAEGINGFEIAFALQSQATKFGAQISFDKVTALSKTDDVFVLETTSGKIEARSVIVATGAKPRRLPLGNTEHLEGRGLSYCATCDGNFFAGKDVVVVGGGDTAAADCVYLSRICNTVHLIHRRDELRANKWYEEKLSALQNVEFHWNSVVVEVLEEDGRVAGVLIEDVNTKETQSISGSACFVAIGTEPHTEWLAGVLNRDEYGYLVAGADTQTSLSGVFAAGDVRTTELRQVVTAASDGAIAAEAAAKFLSF